MEGDKEKGSFMCLPYYKFSVAKLHTSGMQCTLWERWDVSLFFISFFPSMVEIVELLLRETTGLKKYMWPN